jgi:glutamyl-Q tRNA(Asp) synthetase
LPPLSPSFPGDSIASPYRGRFAPSPTGPLHLGSLYTALASYLEARARRGQWRVRIDDVDTPRVVAGAADAILRTLERFGLNWDGAVIRQSERFEAYRQALETLDREGHLYACTCSRRQLHAPFHGEGDLAIYPGHCREANRDRQELHALRLRCRNRVVIMQDRLQGEHRQDFNREVGDFVLRRRDGVYAYHLATVLDDADAGITEVLRGLDLLHSTPRQILLQGLLGLPTPDYLHIPLIIDSAGIKLSKQTGAPPIDADHPQDVLFDVLRLLALQPPRELQGAPCAELLDWAVEHWSVERLRERGTTSTAPTPVQAS